MRFGINGAEASAPPLPELIPTASSRPAPAAPGDGPVALAPAQGLGPIIWPTPPWIRSLRCGCYLINYSPPGSNLITYDGTMRVECHSEGRTASGDLYQRSTLRIPIPGRGVQTILMPGPIPSAGIPILPIGRYRYYLRVTQLLEGWTLAGGFTLGFERHRFNAASASWTNEGAFTAEMSWVTAPASYPAPGDYLTGNVKAADGSYAGRLTMGWISKYLRKARVEIDRVAASEVPLSNGAGVDWKSIGDTVGWDIAAALSNSDVVEPSGESWSNAECHAAMLARRDVSNLDIEWRYHVLCVRRLDATERGIMYDNGATDSNNVPREGCAISSHWVIPDDPSWGLVRGMRFGTATFAYFRTAIHETGHAMGLYHNTVDNGFMNTTDVISASGTAANPFPNNILWRYAPDDQRRLRHMPDIYVRPGGTPFGTSYSSTPISPLDAVAEVPGVVLEVAPLLPAVPIGAPVRVEIVLRNEGATAVEVPASIDMSAGCTRGEVVDPSGVVRTFSPLVLCVDDVPLRMLAPGGVVRGSLTLLRGGQGALFPGPGLYGINVELHWDAGEVEASVTRTSTVMVTAAVDEAHGNAARTVLSTPDTLLTLVLGGDHLEEGISAIKTALENPVLHRHFAFIEAKRVGRPFAKRKADLKAAAHLINEATVMSRSEIQRAAQMVKTGGEAAGAKAIAKAIKEKAAGLPKHDELKAQVDAL